MSSVKSDRNDGGYSVLAIYTFANTGKNYTVTMGFPKYKVLSAAGKFIKYSIDDFFVCFLNSITHLEAILRL
jgi:hypothetical protein